MRQVALGLGLGLIVACRGAPRHPTVVAGAGLTVAIYADRSGVGGRAYVDDRRVLEVPRDGTLDIVDVAGDLELDSVVVASAGDPGAFEASQCERLGADRGLGTGAWLVGHQVAMTTASGAEIAGIVRELGGMVGVIADDDLGAVEVEQLSAVPTDDDDASAATVGQGAALIGRVAYGRTRRGDAVYGPVVSVRASTAAIETADGIRVVVALGALASVRVAGVSGQPTLRCRVHARRPGKQLVRIAYASPGVGWQASYRATLPTDGVDGAELRSLAVATRFAIVATPFWTARPATIELVAGLPDGQAAPVSVWRGQASLGGGPVLVLGAPVEREARLGWVYRGALASPGETDVSDYWHVPSHGLVWLELALAPRPSDVPGPIEIVVDAAAARGVRALVPPANRLDPDAIRIPITASASLVGFRRKRQLVHDGTAIADEVLYSVANRGDAPVTVTIEEELRGFRGAQLRHQQPQDAGAIARGRFRRVVAIGPGAVAQGAFVVQYQPEPSRPR